MINILLIFNTKTVNMAYFYYFFPYFTYNLSILQHIHYLHQHKLAFCHNNHSIFKVIAIQL